MKPVVDRLEQRYTGQITFYVYAEADKNAEQGKFASRQGVRAVPTTVLVSEEGIEIARWVGSTPDETIASEVEKLFSAK
jgi:thioredoxin-like negative regulator of GroEL